MTRKKENKLNRFLVNAPSGEVLTSNWLESHGVSSKLTWWYAHTGLLESLGAKAYKKAGDTIDWAGVVSALQNQLCLPVHIGGKTALQLLGLAHFVMMQASHQVELFAPLATKLPTWLNSTEWKTEFSIVRTSIFNNPDNQLGIVKQTIVCKELQLSCPERAVMELLYRYPRDESFHEVVYLMENLNQLRPKMVQMLLESCGSVKVKRLFLHLAEELNHPWVSALNLTKVDLGQGKRVIEPGGKYYPKYKISLPEIKEQ